MIIGRYCRMAQEFIVFPTTLELDSNVCLAVMRKFLDYIAQDKFRLCGYRGQSP